MSVTENAGQLPGYQFSPAQAASAYASEANSVPPGSQLPRGTGALSFDSLSDHVFPPAAWLADTSLADHPLLRGLLLELPPKGSPPSPEWLDRWFQAARANLELLYMRA